MRFPAFCVLKFSTAKAEKETRLCQLEWPGWVRLWISLREMLETTLEERDEDIKVFPWKEAEVMKTFHSKKREKKGRKNPFSARNCYHPSGLMMMQKLKIHWNFSLSLSRLVESITWHNDFLLVTLHFLGDYWQLNSSQQHTRTFCSSNEILLILQCTTKAHNHRRLTTTTTKLLFNWIATDNLEFPRSSPPRERESISSEPHHSAEQQ